MNWRSICLNEFVIESNQCPWISIGVYLYPEFPIKFHQYHQVSTSSFHDSALGGSAGAAIPRENLQASMTFEFVWRSHGFHETMGCVFNGGNCCRPLDDAAAAELVRWPRFCGAVRGWTLAFIKRVLLCIHQGRPKAWMSSLKNHMIRCEFFWGLRVILLDYVLILL